MINLKDIFVFLHIIENANPFSSANLAAVVKLADTLVLEASGETRGGSSPSSGTTIFLRKKN